PCRRRHRWALAYPTTMKPRHATPRRFFDCSIRRFVDSGVASVVAHRFWYRCRPMEIEGKVAVVTGGASGIGRATVEALIERGGRVVVADIDPAGEQLVADLWSG